MARRRLDPNGAASEETPVETPDVAAESPPADAPAAEAPPAAGQLPDLEAATPQPELQPAAGPPELKHSIDGCTGRVRARSLDCTGRSVRVVWQECLSCGARTQQTDVPMEEKR